MCDGISGQKFSITFNRGPFLFQKLSWTRVIFYRNLFRWFFLGLGLGKEDPKLITREYLKIGGGGIEGKGEYQKPDQGPETSLK